MFVVPASAGKPPKGGTTNPQDEYPTLSPILLEIVQVENGIFPASGGGRLEFLFFSHVLNCNLTGGANIILPRIAFFGGVLSKLWIQSIALRRGADRPMRSMVFAINVFGRRPQK
jgi:hypothetical protein